MYKLYRNLSHCINGFTLWKLIGLFLLMSLGSSAVAEPTLHVVTESLPPLQITEKGEQPKGAMVELVEAVANPGHPEVGDRPS